MRFRMIVPARRVSMNVVAAVLVVLAGLFYAADHNEIGELGSQMCRYGSVFCDKPVYVFAGAVLAALWGTFVSVR
jgi:hypothetical protein